MSSSPKSGPSLRSPAARAGAEMAWEILAYQWFGAFALELALAEIKEGKLGKLLSMNIPILRDLTACVFCVSFWAGFFWSVAGHSQAASFVPSTIAAGVLDGLVTAGVVWFLYIISLRIEPEGL